MTKIYLVTTIPARVLLASLFPSIQSDMTRPKSTPEAQRKLINLRNPATAWILGLGCQESRLRLFLLEFFSA